MKKILLVLALVLSATLTFAQAKYIFFFIGDGMGFGAVTLTEDYLAAKEGKHGSKNLVFSDFPVTGFATTYSASNLVTCSSAAGTALASGNKTRNGVLGMDSAAQHSFKSIAYRLKEKGYKVGVSTSVSIDHATPGAFYAHQPKRSMYYEIAQDLAKSSFDFFSGAGFLQPQGKDKQQPSIFPLLEQNGYKLSRSLADCRSSTAQKNILLQPESKQQDAYPYAIDKGADDYTLSQTTELAIEKLTNSKGFFLMVEGGKVDWASHYNDAAAMVGEVAELSDAVQTALEFYKKHPKETLIIVTADHETGGLGIGAAENMRVNIMNLSEQKMSATKAAISDTAARAVSAQGGANYSTFGHTGTMVPVYAIGVGSELFSGKMDNTDIPKKIAKIAGVSDF